MPFRRGGLVGCFPALHLALVTSFLLLKPDERSTCCKLLLIVPLQVENV